MSDAQQLPRVMPRPAFLIAVIVAIVLACALEVIFIVRSPDGRGIIALPAYLALAAVTVVGVGWVLCRRATRDGDALVVALGASGHPVFALFESRRLHEALGTARSKEEMAQSIGAVLLDEDGMHVWAEREGRPVELTIVPWSGIGAIEVAMVPHGRRVVRCILVRLRAGGEATLVIATRRGQWFAPADDAHFDHALRTVRMRGF